jgi:dCMP deaminase|tara:strand:+ start:100 stop:498 length:399 start_codon:yes stop_codon:yes gene_type:complete
MDRLGWQEYGIKLAETAALRSEDPFVQVGCCIFRPDNSIASLGYNGAPPGINIDWSDRDERRKRVIHAETNALKHIKPREADRMFVTLMPCGDCMKNVASYGIKNIFYTKRYDLDSSAEDLALEFGIDLTQI